jgi:hypothetical protein
MMELWCCTLESLEELQLKEQLEKFNKVFANLLEVLQCLSKRRILKCPGLEVETLPCLE